MDSLDQSEERLLLQHLDQGQYTDDGTVDMSGNPALKQQTGNWRACYFILCMDLCEYLAFFGITKNMVTYLTKELHETNLDAAKNVSIWVGTCFLSPVIGAFLSDSYWGNYKTVMVFAVIYLTGMITLSLSTLVPIHCVSSSTDSPNPAKNILLFLGLYIIAFGSGGIKPCVNSFGATQFDDTDPKERAKRGSFFNWYYFNMKLSSLLSSTVIVWIQDNYGWGLGFLIPTISVGLALVSFASGSRVYRYGRRPNGSPVTRICRVVVAAMRKCNLDLPSDSSLLYEIQDMDSAITANRKLEHTDNLKFLDKAAIFTASDFLHTDHLDPWRVCTVTQVEELKILIKLFPIFTTVIIHSACLVQISTTFVEQGMFMRKTIGSFNIPPASLSSIEVFAVIIGLPIYDKILVPIARNLSGKESGLTHLQRIGIGLFLSILAMVTSALAETKRLEIARENGLTHEKIEVPMNIAWLIPQYYFMGTSEVFTLVGQMEFFYSEAPDSMRSLSLAFWLVMVSLSNYFVSLLLTLIGWITTQGGRIGWIPDNLNEGRLDLFFWLMGGLSLINLIVFLHLAARYKWK